MPILPQLLILDVDETLIYAGERPLDRCPDFCVGPYHVYCRPGLAAFLSQCQHHFRVAIWSSSGADYLNAIVVAVFADVDALEFVWSRERCVQRFDPERLETYFVKDLKKVKRLGFSLNAVIVVDDTPQKLERQYGNAIYIAPFTGDPSDNELAYLSQYLVLLAGVEDVRRVEKRGWRTKYRTP